MYTLARSAQFYEYFGWRIEMNLCIQKMVSCSCFKFTFHSHSFSFIESNALAYMCNVLKTRKKKTHTNSSKCLLHTHTRTYFCQWKIRYKIIIFIWMGYFYGYVFSSLQFPHLSFWAWHWTFWVIKQYHITSYEC